MGVKELTISHVKSHLQVNYFSSSSIPSHLKAMTVCVCFPVGATVVRWCPNKLKASDSSVCFSDEQMYRAARLGAGRRGER